MVLQKTVKANRCLGYQKIAVLKLLLLLLFLILMCFTVLCKLFYNKVTQSDSIVHINTLIFNANFLYSKIEVYCV